MEDIGETAQVRLQIRGRVQGVFFRASTVQQAQALGLSGWVMNCNDGSVTAVAEGRRESLEKLIAWCGQGPPGAQVTEVRVDWRRPRGSFRRFTVKR